MAADVLCEVDSCTFWASGNRCDATKIYVVASHTDEPSKSEETDCKTFERKEDLPS